MYPSEYVPLVEEETVPHNFLLIDSITAHRSLDCRAADWPYADDDKKQISDKLPYKESSALQL